MMWLLGFITLNIWHYASQRMLNQRLVHPWIGGKKSLFPFRCPKSLLTYFKEGRHRLWTVSLLPLKNHHLLWQKLALKSTYLSSLSMLIWYVLSSSSFLILLISHFISPFALWSARHFAALYVTYVLNSQSSTFQSEPVWVMLFWKKSRGWMILIWRYLM